jgi:hypothetical protein
MMIPDCHRRLEKAFGELKAIVAEVEAIPEFAEIPELGAARQAILEADDHLKAE